MEILIIFEYLGFFKVSSSSIGSCTKPNFARVKMFVWPIIFAQARKGRGNLCINNMRTRNQRAVILEENEKTVNPSIIWTELG